LLAAFVGCCPAERRDQAQLGEWGDAEGPWEMHWRRAAMTTTIVTTTQMASVEGRLLTSQACERPLTPVAVVAAVVQEFG
jgi:hypothetical protein